MVGVFLTSLFFLFFYIFFLFSLIFVPNPVKSVSKIQLMFNLCSSDTIFEEKNREIYGKCEKSLSRRCAIYFILFIFYSTNKVGTVKMLCAITTTRLTHVCVYWCVKIVRAACTISTHTVGCACIESKTLYLAAYIPTL